jgi:60Kd inner membrane protein
MTEFVARPFGALDGTTSGALKLFHYISIPWWLSIVLLTISVRAALFPLTIRQTKSMRAVQELKPEMDEIRCRYKDDRQKQQEAIMNLYRKRRIDLLAHFLPILCTCPCSSRCTKSCATTKRPPQALRPAASSGSPTLHSWSRWGFPAVGSYSLRSRGEE